MLTLLRRGLLVFLAAFPLLSMAAPTPQQVVQGTVDELLSDIKANKAAYKADPQKLYATLDRILGPVVDAEGIAKSVMTVKYSRQASPEQIKRFEEVFKNSLMQFYGNALLEYDNQDIRVLPSSAKPSDDRASVNMEIRDSKGTVYPVSYTMTNLAGGWKVRNVIINGINIGKLFRRPVRRHHAEEPQRPREDHRRLGRGGRQGQGNRESGRGRGEMSQASLREGAAGELQLAGVLDYSSGPALREQGGRLIRASQAAELVVDCSAVERSSSVGISLLLAFMRDARKAGKVLSVRALPDDMREIAKVSSLLEILPLQE